jgi:uncharacterized metal-binding protein YceD (DUF177 family)
VRRRTIFFYICTLNAQLMVKAFKPYDIQFVGLKIGHHEFAYDIDSTFFEAFDYAEFNDAALKAHVFLDKKTTILDFKFEVSGLVNVNCDVTNEPFDLSVQGQFELVVNFGEEFNDDNESILILPHGSFEMNVAQYIFELIVLSIPAKREHPGIVDGTLNSDILSKLEELNPNNSRYDQDHEVDPRWEGLKNLLTDN